MTPALTRRFYIVAWLLLGATSLGYVFMLFQQSLQPVPADAVASSESHNRGSSETPPTPVRSDPGVTQALAHMKKEIDRLRASLDAANKEKSALQAHIRELEAAYGPSTASIPREPNAPRADDLKPGDDGSTQPGARSNVDVTLLPMPMDGFADPIPESPLPIAQTARPKRTQFAVELAAGLSTTAVAERWKDIVGRHGTLLQDLSPHAVSMRPQAGSKRYRLIAGPFKNAAGAARLCARLSAAGTRCEGTVFAGKPLNQLAAR